MKNFLFFSLLFSFNALALEAVITVLEAPLLEEKSRQSKVVQYLRRGDVIKIDPSVANSNLYDHLAPSAEKLARVRERLSQTPEWQEDKMFKGDETRQAHLEDEFIPTLDRRGRTAYVLSEHIYVYFNDPREIRQPQNRKDLTDYRLQEPLPKKYPIEQPVGLRGQLTLGFTQPYSESYPYLKQIKTKGYESPLDLNFTYLKVNGDDKQDRAFIGLTLNIKRFQNSYVFDQTRQSTEKYTKIGLGPTISYDAYKGDKNRVNLYATMNVYLWNQLHVIQQNDQGQVDTRRYRSFSAAPLIGFQYHRKNFMENLDFILGSGLEFGLPTRYAAQSGASQPSWWRHGGTDSFTTRSTVLMSLYLGLQQTY